MHIFLYFSKTICMCVCLCAACHPSVHRIELISTWIVFAFLLSALLWCGCHNRMLLFIVGELYAQFLHRPAATGDGYCCCCHKSAVYGWEKKKTFFWQRVKKIMIVCLLVISWSDVSIALNKNFLWTLLLRFFWIWCGWDVVAMWKRVEGYLWGEMFLRVSYTDLKWMFFSP